MWFNSGCDTKNWLFSIEVDGMDLIILRGGRMSRNGVYFDRMAVLNELK